MIDEVNQTQRVRKHRTKIGLLKQTDVNCLTKNRLLKQKLNIKNMRLLNKQLSKNRNKKVK